MRENTVIFTRLVRWLIVFLIVVGMEGCGTHGPGKWTQFHADAPSRGTNFISTEFATRPAWIVDVGTVVYSSPVIGGDGTIYVGNLEGELIATNPDGTEKWRLGLGSPIMSTPAVADNGRIYVITTSQIGEPEPFDTMLRSFLWIVDMNGGLLEFVALPDEGFTTGSAKIWASDSDTFVFIHARTKVEITSNLTPSAVLIYDQDGQLVHRKDLGCGRGLLLAVQEGYGILL